MYGHVPNDVRVSEQVVQERLHIVQRVWATQVQQEHSHLCVQLQATDSCYSVTAHTLTVPAVYPVLRTWSKEPHTHPHMRNRPLALSVAQDFPPDPFLFIAGCCCNSSMLGWKAWALRIAVLSEDMAPHTTGRAVPIPGTLRGLCA